MGGSDVPTLVKKPQAKQWLVLVKARTDAGTALRGLQTRQRNTASREGSEGFRSVSVGAVSEG
jgi:hypothetical protein